jgi:hypothetical protein
MPKMGRSDLSIFLKRAIAISDDLYAKHCRLT